MQLCAYTEHLLFGCSLALHVDIVLLLGVQLGSPRSSLVHGPFVEVAPSLWEDVRTYVVLLVRSGIVWPQCGLCLIISHLSTAVQRG